MDPGCCPLCLPHAPPPLHGDPMEASPSLLSCPSPPTQHGEKQRWVSLPMERSRVPLLQGCFLDQQHQELVADAASGPPHTC